jgi:transposase
MGQAIPLSLRHQIIELYTSGSRYASIAKTVGKSYDGVRKIVRQYKSYGIEGLRTNYKQDRAKQSDELLYRCGLWLKRHHPQWGAPLIRSILSNRYPTKSIPTVRTFQLWFKESKLNVSKSKIPKIKLNKSTEVHQTWQIDAKERFCIATGQQICWLNISDEYSRSLLDSRVFSPQTDQ